MFSDLRDMISQTFGISIKNLRRRRARTLLALAPLALISASAMCLLTFTSMNPIYWAPSYRLKPKVNNGLVIYKRLIATARSYFTSGSASTVTNYIPLQPYEVSLFMGDWVELINIYGIYIKSEYMMNMTNIVKDLASLGFSYWETETATFMQRYLINAIFNGSLLHVSPESSVITLFGNWQDHIVPLIIASLVLFMNTLSIISERTSEIRTLFAIGASPRRISLIFIIEGLTLGIMGGIFGYIIGYIMTQITNLTLPSSVQKNLISVSPFTVAFSISIITSVSGCLIPSRMAV